MPISLDLVRPTSRRPMTAPRRWYQLSMLQMLVTMAVVAAIIPPNVFAKRDVSNRKSTGFKVVFIH